MTKEKEIHLSVIIPAYNEAERISETLLRIRAFLERQPYQSEIIVVDDGSTDHTVSIAARSLEGSYFEILEQRENQGKGAAVKRGMLEASGKYRLFSDADLSTPIEEVVDFLDILEAGGYDLVIGSRAMQHSELLKKQPVWRRLMGRTFNQFAKLITFHHIQDSQCGFKCFTQKAARELFRRQMLSRFSFDAEILFLAQKLKLKVLEKPVQWKNSPNSRVNVIKDSINMFIDLFRIRLIHMGRYRH